MSGSPKEKSDGSFDQTSDVAANDVPTNGDVPHFDKHRESKLIRKIDWRLLPILGALYSVALIDRVNVSSRLPLPNPKI
jgi:hypothetical protein